MVGVVVAAPPTFLPADQGRQLRKGDGIKNGVVAAEVVGGGNGGEEKGTEVETEKGIKIDREVHPETHHALLQTITVPVVVEEEEVEAIGRGDQTGTIPPLLLLQLHLQPLQQRSQWYEG